MRRNLINAVLAVVLIPATIVLVLRMMPDDPVTEVAFPNPMHRVAVALDEVFQAELTSLKYNQVEINEGFMPVIPAGTKPVPGSSEISEDLNVFWMTAGASKVPELWSLQTFTVEGKTRDGRTITASIESPTFGNGSVVNFGEDAEAARKFTPKIAERLAHPKHKHQSPEDRAALIAFFQPKISKATSFTQFVDPAVIPAKLAPAVELPVLDSKDAIR